MQRRSRHSRAMFPSGSQPKSAAQTPASGALTDGRKPVRRVGFVTILILLMLLMMLMLVLVYIRTMRAFNMVHPRFVANADPVVSQIENDIANIIGADGKIDDYEPYDYPWTCTRFNAPCRLSYPQVVSSTQGLGDPKVDDSWLSPCEPEGDKWAQVTNLYGSFLAYDNANLSNVPVSANHTDFVPADVPAGMTVAGMAGASANGQTPVAPYSTALAAPFQNLSLTDPRLVDTDGDGVPDSLWCYPPNNLQGGLRYVAAVRIVDLSGLINLNTALGEMTTPGILGKGAIVKKGEGPYEIDPSPIVGTMPNSSMQFRQKTTGAPASWTDWQYWQAAGAQAANNGVPYGDDGNGTKVDTVTPAAPITRTGIRYDINDEIQLRDFSNRITSATTPPPVLGTHYPGLNLTTSVSSRPAIAAYASLSSDLQARNRLTTLNGVCDVRQPLPYTANRQSSWGWDLPGKRPFDLYANQSNLTTPVWNVANAYQVNDLALVNDPSPATTGKIYMAKVAMAANTSVAPPSANWSFVANNTVAGANTPPFSYGITGTGAGGGDTYEFYESNNTPGVPDFLWGIDKNNPGVAYPFPAGFNFLTASNTLDVRIQQYQTQMGANSFHDALARNNQPTVASSWMGWKPLPIMTEFYEQMPYVVMAPYQTPWNWSNATLPTAAQAVLVFPNTTVSQLTLPYLQNLAVLLNGWGTYARAQVFFYTNNGTTATAQFQAFTGSNQCISYNATFTNSSSSPVGVQMTITSTGNITGSGNIGTDSTATTGSPIWAKGGIYLNGFQLGLPVKTGSTWTQIYTNLAFNRTATGGAGTGTGEFIFGGNNLTSTDWRASCSAGMPSYAIELANPYQIPIRIANLRFNFREQDWRNWDAGFTKAAATPAYASADLSTYVNAAPPAGMAQDAEGYYVLKPGERIVFYRNGADLPGPGGARRKPFSGSSDISTLIASGSGVYKVDLGTGNNAPDLGGHPSTWNVAAIDIEAATQGSSGASFFGNVSYGWMNCQRMVFQPLHSGWDAGNNCNKFETNVPDGRQGAPGDLVYRQIDARTFGVNEKMNLLQVRPPPFPIDAGTSTNQMPTDMGDEEFRTNTYAAVGGGMLPNGSAKPYPDGKVNLTISGQSCYGCVNTPGTTMPLGHCNANTNPASSPSAPYAYLDYDGTNGASNSVSALGSATKVSFPGPNGGNAMYGGTARQNIKNENWVWNYVGIPGDANYPGTFPELAAANNANRTIRDNSASGAGGPERRDGLRPLDLLKVPLVGPIYNNWSGLNVPASASTYRVGNNNYRGTNTTGGWDNGPIASPLVGSLLRNTIGDALNFYLTQDAQNLGLRGLCLRTDVPWFDWANAATKYPSLPYNAATSYTVDQEALSGGDIYAAQQAGTLAAPDPTPGTGNVGPSQPWKLSNGPYACASQFWQQSWGEIACSRWQVDGPKYKGNTGSNGLNFKPGMINLNTASKTVLQCLSLPYQPGSTTTPVDSGAVADAIIASRQNPTAGSNVAGGTRKGLVLASEAFSGKFLADGTTLNTDPAKGPKAYAPAAQIGAAPLLPSKFYTSDLNLNLETLSWLPQQAACRSDTFCAYIIVQGYQANDFNKGPIDVRRMVVLYSRDTSGNAAKILSASVVPDR